MGARRQAVSRREARIRAAIFRAMRHSSRCALALLLAACSGERGDDDSAGGATGLEPGDHLVDFGGVSTYVHVPPDVEAGALIVFLHGISGAGTWDGSAWQAPNPTNLAQSSDELGFVLAVPGVSTTVDDHEWHLDDASAAEIDAVVAGVRGEVSIDAARAFVIGVSKGGAMATWYGLHHVGAAARGIATISGGYPFGYPEVEPDPKLPFYVAHDPRDPEIPYTNAEQLAADLEAHGHVLAFEDWELGQDGHGWNPDLPQPMLEFLIDAAD
jgi:poly(3-hydroxybutyrate) depolymerase